MVATIGERGQVGRGECVPYARYGESVDGVARAIDGLRRGHSGWPRPGRVADAAPSRRRPQCPRLRVVGPRRQALGTERGRACRARAAPRRGHGLHHFPCVAGRDGGASRRRLPRYPLLKLKLGGDGDEARLAAIRDAVPMARLIADANEAWRAADLERLMAAAAAARVELIEQPLPAGEDDALRHIARAVPVCADESVHDRASLAAIADRYDAVNIKLDKTGGLTEALATAAEARRLGLKIMAGSMVATSLAMAPALLVAQNADWVDLDGPLLLERDRAPGLTYESGTVSPSAPGLWGGT